MLTPPFHLGCFKVCHGTIDACVCVILDSHKYLYHQIILKQTKADPLDEHGWKGTNIPASLSFW